MRPSFMSDSFIGWQMLVFFYRSCQAHLRGLGLEVKFSRAADAHVLVGKVPLCFTEKDINERKRGRSSVFKPIVEVHLVKFRIIFRIYLRFYLLTSTVVLLYFQYILGVST